MPGAIIVADQSTGAGSGVAGTARDDLWLNKEIDLSIATSGNTSVSWELLDIPPGSTASLATPTAPTCAFTPDVVGTYRIRLITNNGGAGNVQILALRVRYTSSGALANRGWALPALGESGTSENNYDGNTRGYDEVFRSILDDLEPWAGGLTALQNGSSIGQQRAVNFIGAAVTNNTGNSRIDVSLPRYVELPFVAVNKSTTNVSPGETIGGRQLNLGILPSGTKHFYFVATLMSEAASPIAWVELWNVTRAYMVTNAQLSNTSASNAQVQQTFVSSELTLGTSSGNLRSDSNDEYEVRGYRAGGSTGDYVACLNCHLRVTFD